MRWLWLVGVFPCLTACLTATPGVDEEAVLQSFVGRPVAEVRTSWGEPRQIIPADGGEVYIWEATRYGSDYLPANLNRDDLLYTEGREALVCRARMQVVDGIVTAAEWLGSECREP